MNAHLNALMISLLTLATILIWPNITKVILASRPLDWFCRRNLGECLKSEYSLYSRGTDRAARSVSPSPKQGV